MPEIGDALRLLIAPAGPVGRSAITGARVVQEAIEAGALRFSPVPGTFAAEDELFGLGRAMAAGGQAVVELAPQDVAGEDIVAPRRNWSDVSDS